MTSFFILLAGIITRFWNFGHPLQVVFDEVHFGEFINNYWNHVYFLDIHPPFTRLLLAGWGWLTGIDTIHTDWTTIGNQMSEATASLRLIPGIAGALLPLVIYLICKKLKFSHVACVAAALIACFDNSLVVGSRFILQDSTMLLAGFSAILFYLISLENKRPTLYLILSAVCATAAVGSKWIGISYLAVILALELHRVITTRAKKSLKELVKPYARFAVSYAIIIAVLYTSLIAIHLSILTRSGSGDGFMSREFKKTLIGSKDYTATNIEPAGIGSKIVELTRVSYRLQKDQTFNHPYMSKWYTWPIMQRGIYYWHQSNPDQYIYYFGNPLIYWAGSLAIALLIIASILHLVRDRSALFGDRRNQLIFIVFGYLINFLPFALIPRPMFLYHYAAALVFSIMAIAFLIDQIPNHQKKVLTACVAVATACLIFIYFSPLTYGTPMTKQERDSRVWFSSWK